MFALRSARRYFYGGTERISAEFLTGPRSPRRESCPIKQLRAIRSAGKPVLSSVASRPLSAAVDLFPRPGGKVIADRAPSTEAIYLAASHRLLVGGDVSLSARAAKQRVVHVGIVHRASFVLFTRSVSWTPTRKEGHPAGEALSRVTVLSAHSADCRVPENGVKAVLISRNKCAPSAPGVRIPKQKRAPGASSLYSRASSVETRQMRSLQSNRIRVDGRIACIGKKPTTAGHMPRSLLPSIGSVSRPEALQLARLRSRV